MRFHRVMLMMQVVGYALLGAVVFRAVEGPHETFIQSQVTAARQKAVNIAWNATFRSFIISCLLKVFYPNTYILILSSEISSTHKNEIIY